MSSRAALAVLILYGVFLPEFCVDANCRHRPFCCSDDCELDTSGRITSNKQARNIGPLATASLDCIVAAQIAAKLDGQLGRLLRLGAEKQSLTVNDVAVLEADPLKARLAALQTSNWIFNDPDALPAESVAIFLCERHLSVGAKDNVTAPDGHLKMSAALEK